jgi:hypothetical protein
MTDEAGLAFRAKSGLELKRTERRRPGTTNAAETTEAVAMIAMSRNHMGTGLKSLFITIPNLAQAKVLLPNQDIGQYDEMTRHS